MPTRKLWLNVSLSLSRAVFVLVAIALAGEGAARAQEGARRDEETAPAPPAQPKLTAAPVLLQAAAPEYPPAAVAAGKTAQVKVRIRIEADGTVQNASVVTPVGDGFDQAALDAVKQYRFKPAEWDGVPGAIVVETTIHFVIEEKEETPPPPVTNRPSQGASDPDALGPPQRGGDVRKAVSISGVALERGTRRKLAGVIVSIAELGVDVVTDASGRFYFHGVAAGEYAIIALDDRFERFTRSLSLDVDESVDLKLYMRPKGGNPYQTVVEGERERLEVTRRSLDRRQLTTVPGTFGDPIRVIQTLPGLARSPFSTGFLLIRGSNPDDSGVFIDGHRVPLLFHFLGGPSVLNSEFLDSIDLYPGGYPARYGRAIGGIVSVETRDSKSDGVHGSADIDILDASAYLRVPVGEKGSLAVAGRRSYLDFVLGFFLPDAKPGKRLIVVPVYDDQQLRFDYDFGRQGKASLFAIRSSDTLKVLRTSAEEQSDLAINTSIGFSRIMAKYQRPIIGGLRLTLSPALGTDSFEISGGPGEEDSPFFGVEVVARYINYRMRIDGKLSKNIYLDTGIDLESRRTRYELLIPLADDIRSDDNIDVPPELLIRNVDTLMMAAHADIAIDLGKLRLVPGLRFDSYLLNAHPQYTVDPRIVARYQLTTDFAGKGYVGLFHQPPQPEALDSEFGNPEVQPERAVHVGVGGEWKLARHWNFDFEGYFIDRSNQVTDTSRVVEDPETGDLRRIFWENTRVGDTVGFEFLLRRQVTEDFFGWISYTLSKTRQRDRSSEDYVASNFDQRHTLNWVASYRLGKGWELGGRYRMATGRPITDVSGGTFDADSGSYKRVNGVENAARRKTFHQVDARLEKTWTFDTYEIGVYLDVQNLLNTVNAEGTQYDYRFRERSPVASVPFLPTLGLRGQF